MSSWIVWAPEEKEVCGGESVSRVEDLEHLLEKETPSILAIHPDCIAHAGKDEQYAYERIVKRARADGSAIALIHEPLNHSIQPAQLGLYGADILLPVADIADIADVLDVVPASVAQRPFDTHKAPYRLEILTGLMGCGKSTVQQALRSYGLYTLRSYKSRNRGNEPDVQIGASRTNVPAAVFLEALAAKARGERPDIDYIATLSPPEMPTQFYGRERIEQHSYVAHMGLFAFGQTGNELVHEHSATHDASVHVLTLPPAFRKHLLASRPNATAVLDSYRETYENTIYPTLMNLHATLFGLNVIAHSFDLSMPNEHQSVVPQHQLADPLPSECYAHLEERERDSVRFANQCAVLARHIISKPLVPT